MTAQILPRRVRAPITISMCRTLALIDKAKAFHDYLSGRGCCEPEFIFLSAYSPICVPEMCSHSFFSLSVSPSAPLQPPAHTSPLTLLSIAQSLPRSFLFPAIGRVSCLSRLQGNMLTTFRRPRRPAQRVCKHLLPRQQDQQQQRLELPLRPLLPPCPALGWRQT